MPPVYSTLQEIEMRAFGAGIPATPRAPGTPTWTTAKTATPGLSPGAKSSRRRARSLAASRPPRGMTDWLSDFLAGIF